MRLNLYIFTICLSFCLKSIDLKAQRRITEIDPEQKERKEDEKRLVPDKLWHEKLMYGGNAWFSMWGGTGMLLLQPQVAYPVNERLIVGTGATYIYWQNTFRSRTPGVQTIRISDHVIGFNFFSRVRMLGPLFAHVEYMPMNFTSVNLLNETKRLWGNSLFVGGGYSSSRDGRGSYIMVLYDVLWRDPFTLDPNKFNRSFYRSPYDIRVGLFF
jgi:hypothetical protein